jgi:cysteine desulfurase
MSPPSVYLDYNATTPLDPAVRRVLVEALDSAWANPSSIHTPGRHARALLDDTRDRVAALLRCRPSEIVFTSGGTEANNLAVLGTARLLRRGGRHLLCSPVEHPSVLACHRQLASREGFELTLLPVDACGRVDPADLKRAIRPETALVSIMAANNETGVLQPVADLARICRDHGVPFHTDAVQWFGKMPLEDLLSWGADLIPICAHKFHGPKGVGALFIRSPLLPDPFLRGGSQENERRAGTENLPAIVAFTEALSRFAQPPVFPAALLRPWTARLATSLLRLHGVAPIAPTAERLPNTLAFTVEDTDSIALLANLDLAGVSASSGSACSAGSVEPSHVLRAMGLSEARASSLVRFSLGRENTAADIARVEGLLPELIQRCREPGNRGST